MQRLYFPWTLIDGINVAGDIINWRRSQDNGSALNLRVLHISDKKKQKKPKNCIVTFSFSSDFCHNTFIKITLNLIYNSSL